MNKICTTIEQSKKLIELGIDVDTADMYLWYSGRRYYVEAMDDGDFNKESDTPAWSITSLLGVIPKHIENFNVLRIDIGDNDFAIWYDEIGYGVNNDLPNITMESALDACYEMVVRLKENGKI